MSYINFIMIGLLLREAFDRLRVRLNVYLVDTAINEWRNRLRACVRAKGRHFKHLLYYRQLNNWTIIIIG